MLTNSNVFSTKFKECDTIVNTTILRGLNSTKCYQPLIGEFIAFPEKNGDERDKSDSELKLQRKQ